MATLLQTSKLNNKKEKEPASVVAIVELAAAVEYKVSQGTHLTNAVNKNKQKYKVMKSILTKSFVLF